jgi:hypothetical protein
MHYRYDDLETSPDKPEQLGGTWWYRGVGKRRGQGAILGFAQAGTLARHTPQGIGSGYFQAFTTCEATSQNKRTREMTERLVQIRQLTPFSTAGAKIGFVDGGRTVSS